MQEYTFRKSISYAFLAQGVLFLSSCITNLILPKYLGVVAYSYWQLFVFYANFIPLLALGLNDGIYLRYGGEKFETLNFSAITNQFILGLLYQIVLYIVLVVFCIVTIYDVERLCIVMCVGIYFLLFTMHNFLGYLFQTTNHTAIYSQSLLAGTIVYLLFQTSAVLLGVYNYYFYIVFYISVYFIAGIFLLFKIIPYLKDISVNLKKYIRDLIITVRLGIPLMLSNVCSMLIVGFMRQLIDMKWGLLVFGKISFSLTLINFFLSFIGQISLVIFPRLRRIKENSRNEFMKMYYISPIFISGLYVLYYPLQYILNLWLPMYNESITMLIYLMPLCFFDCKMNLIGNTFLKVFMKQDYLLKLNILSLVIAFFIGIVDVFYINSLMLMIYGIVISITLRSVLASIYIAKIFKLKVLLFEIVDILLALYFFYMKEYIIFVILGVISYSIGKIIYYKICIYNK